MINILGVPLDENSSFLRGPALAPRKILEALRSNSSNLSSENGFDLGANENHLWRDAGDLVLPSGPTALEAIHWCLVPRDVPTTARAPRFRRVGNDEPAMKQIRNGR